MVRRSRMMDDKELIAILTEESKMLRRDYWNLQEKYANQFQQFVKLKHKHGED
jgi:hypothetical protein